MYELNGSCNCGAVRYHVTGKIRSIVNCHCNLCRKMNGSAFSTYVAVSDDDFELLSGRPKSHNASEHAVKKFCGECGTPIYNSNPKYAGLKILHLGSIDETLDIEPSANIYCESRLEWLEKLPGIRNLEQGFE